MNIFSCHPNSEAEFFIFIILNLNFRGVPSLYQGIVGGCAPPNLMYDSHQCIQLVLLLCATFWSKNLRADGRMSP